MAAAITIEVRSTLNPSDPIRLTEEDLAASVDAPPSLASRVVNALLRPEIRISSPYFGSKVVAPGGSPAPGSELLALGAVLLVVGLAAYGAVRLLRG